MNDRAFTTLIDFLSNVPSVIGEIGKGSGEDGRWWVKFTIDINHELAWHAVQELGHVLNYLSLEERLPTSFYPVSPPPYMNDGPEDFLSWVIECNDPEFRPGTCASVCKEGYPILLLTHLNGKMNKAHSNKRTQSHKTTRYARGLAADARRQICNPCRNAAGGQIDKQIGALYCCRGPKGDGNICTAFRRRRGPSPGFSERRRPQTIQAATLLHGI